MLNASSTPRNDNEMKLSMKVNSAKKNCFIKQKLPIFPTRSNSGETSNENENEN